MASRHLGMVCILGCSWLVAVACGSDDNTKQQPAEAGGEAGESGKGGTPSSGGSSNNAGTSNNNGGNAGKGGTSGGSGGIAGEGGTGAMSAAGTAGANEGGQVGEPGGAAGAAGAAGAEGGGGAGGASTVEQAKLCYTQCQMDQDCSGSGSSLVACNVESHRCEDRFAQCTVNADCWAEENWTQTCQTDNDCDGDVCVAFRGAGFCAVAADSETGCPPFFPSQEAFPRFGADGTADVCVSLSYRCIDGTCAEPCNVDSCPDSGTGDTCNTDTGRCECQTGAECNSTVCGSDHHCVQCVTDDQCTAPGQDKCVNGKCGCASADSCPAQGQATLVCQ